jgi:hypothetical protein
MTGEEIRIAQTAAKGDSGHNGILTAFRPQENPFAPKTDG